MNDLQGAIDRGDDLEPSRPLRVLVAENHRDLSDLIRELIDLEPDMCCVGQVGDAAEVLESARASAADCVILDLNLHGGSGLPLVQELSQTFPEIRVVVFSGIGQREEVAREARRRGAAAFVPKGADLQCLLEALRPEASRLPSP